MDHAFNINIAEQFGIFEAIFLNNLAHWVKINTANKLNKHDGRFWTYNTVEAFGEIFSYWSSDQIKRVINSCLKQGLIVKSRFNKKGYDRTNWYALTDFGLNLFGMLKKKPKEDENPPQPAPALIGRNRQMDSAKSPNGLGEITQPIPDINTDINSDKKTTDENTFVFDLETDRKIKERLEDLPQGEKTGIQLLKEIYFNVQKHYPKSKWEGINGALSLIRKGQWGTPSGYVDQSVIEAEKAKIKAHQEAMEKAITEDSDRKMKSNYRSFCLSKGITPPDWCLV